MTVGNAVTVASTADIDRADWLELRRSGIGGSDVAPILGMSQWSTPLQVWLEKTGMYVPEDAPSEAMEWGTLLEPVVADEFTRRSGIETKECRNLLASADEPHMLANVDRLIACDPVREVADEGVYEGKTTSPWSRKEWANNQVPDAAALQSHHYLTVTGFSYAYVAVLIGGQRLEWRLIERDVEIATYLRREEREFWRLVQNMEPPAATDRDAHFLGEVWTPAPETVATLAPDLVKALDTRDRAKRLIKKLEQRAAAAEAEVKLAMGDREFGATDDGTVLCSWREIPESEVAAYTRKSYRRFTTVKSKTTKNGAAA